MSRLNRSLLILLLLAWHGASAAPRALAAPGKTTANYLDVDVGGRGVAMAGTQFGSDGEVFAAFYNPALLGRVERREMGVMHNEFLSDLRQEVFAYVHPTERAGNFAAALNYFSYGDISGFNAQGAPTGKVSASDMMFSGSWAKDWEIVMGERMFKGLSTGLTGKVLNKKLHNDSALGFAMDAGLSYALTGRFVEGTQAAASLSNFGPGLKFRQESSPLPTAVRIGLARSFWGDAFTATVDEVMPFHSDPYPAAALEYKLRKMFSLRVGYKGDKSLDQELTYGAGFETSVFKVDYAFVPFEDLGDSHRISVTLRFGKNVKRRTTDEQLALRIREAETLFAQGLLVDAYLVSIQVQRVAPWLDANNRLISKIQKDFQDLEESDRKEKQRLQAEALFKRAEQFFVEGNLINARLEFQTLLGLDPGHKQAQSYLKQIEGQFRSFLDSFYREGMLAFAEENYEKAKEEFEKVLAIRPDHAEAREQLSRCVEEIAEREREAREAQRKDILEKTYSEALQAFRSSEFEKALALFKDVLAVDPGHADALRYEAMVKRTLHEHSLKTGRDHAAKGQWELAIRNLKKALEYNPGSGAAKEILKDAERRWDLQKKVVSQNLYKQGLEAFLAGDKKKAQGIWEKALELDPKNEGAIRGLSRIQ